MKSYKSLRTLTEFEMKKNSAGCFSFDLGWMIGSSLTGKFTSLAGTVDAITQYALYHTTHGD